MYLAQNLRFFRKNKGYSQETVARLMNIDRSQISRYENGQDLPSIDLLDKFADLYHTSIDDLVGLGNKRINDLSLLLNCLNDNQMKLMLMLVKQDINVINKFIVLKGSE